MESLVQKRVLRYFRRQGLLDELDAAGMLSWQGSGGFSVDASVRIEAADWAGIEFYLAGGFAPGLLEAVQLAGPSEADAPWWAPILEGILQSPYARALAGMAVGLALSGTFAPTALLLSATANSLNNFGQHQISATGVAGNWRVAVAKQVEDASVRLSDDVDERIRLMELNHQEPPSPTGEGGVALGVGFLVSAALRTPREMNSKRRRLPQAADPKGAA